MSKSDIKKIVIIIGIIIIPLMYSFFYLKAFWDPYETLSELPVAIVNEDNGAIINEEERNIGEELQKELEKSNELKFCFVDYNEANTGLEEEKYYAIIKIPEDFSSDIASASTRDKTSAEIYYMPNEKSNFLASQILGKAIISVQDELKSNVAEEITNQLSDKLKEVPDKFEEINDGVSQLYDGALSLNEGTTLLANGTNELNNKYLEFNKGVAGLKAGTNDLSLGSKDLDKGITDLLNGSLKLSEYTKDLYKIDDGVKVLNQGSKDLSNGVSSYVDGVNTFVTTNNNIASLLKTYIANNPSCLSDPNMQSIATILNDPTLFEKTNILLNSGDLLKTSSLTLSTGINSLSQSTSNLPALNTGVNDLTTGLKKVSVGSNSLVLGVDKLNSGASVISSSSNKIKDAVSGINQGSQTLNSGAIELKDGIKLAGEEITIGIENVNTELESLDGLGEFIHDPVKIEQNTVNPVANYGTAFAPYFMSLSIWVGGLMIFFGIYLDADGRFSILSRNSDKKVIRTFIYLGIGLAQSLLLAVVLKYGLGLQVANTFGYYLVCALISLVFISIIQFLMVVFKDVGKFLVILLLILQLTSCGGTFPMELVPSFFNGLYKFMPMTYSVSLLKDVICGGILNSSMLSSVVILSVMFVAFTAVTIVVSKVRKIKES